MKVVIIVQNDGQLRTASVTCYVVVMAMTHHDGAERKPTLMPGNRIRAGD
jgi:hypothetical protein